ncbi:MAG: ABC transporter permease [Candidatus Acidiferrales bacterium]
MHNLWKDIRFGLRMLAKSPGFTLIAVITLALGIGANTAIFSLMNQILLQRLPVKNPSELVILRAPGPVTGHVSDDGDAAESFSYPMYKGLRDNNSVFSGIFGMYGFPASVANHGETDRASGELVSGNYFDVLGVQPAVGRLFSQDDDRVPGAQPVVVLSNSYWERRFGGDPSVLNKVLLINNVEMTVVGVSQAGFFGVQVGKTPDIFVPLMMTRQMIPTGGETLDEWNDYWMNVLARRKPGISLKQAEAGINAAYQPLLAEQLPQIKSAWNQEKRQRFLDKKIFLSSGARGRTNVQRDAGAQLITLFVMVSLVLLIACTNVANLLLARGASRQREFAIRTAMGASRGRMIRQLLAESLLCAFGGGALGIVLGNWLMRVLIPIVVSNAGIRGLTERLDPGVLAFAIGATLFSGIFFGLLPAWRVTRLGVSDVIKDQGSTSSASVSHVGFRKALVAGQVAFTILLLAGAGLFMRSLWNLQKQDLGLKTSHVITFSIQPQLNGYDTPRSIALFDQLRGRLAALPGVSSVGTSEIPILTGDNDGSNITAEGGPELAEELQDVDYDPVGPGFFSTMGIPLLSGREFTEADGATAPKVAVVSESMVKRFFPGRNPLGAHFAFGGKSQKPDIEIVGLVKDVRQEHVSSAILPYVYIPYAQRPKLSGMTFYVRSTQDPVLLGTALQGEVRQLDANLPVYDLKTMERVVDQDLFSARMIAVLSAAFAGLAALLAALGIYGVLAYVVVQRTREIGIRMALGAVAGHVRLLILKEVGTMVLIGVGVGLPLAYGLARFSESLLYGVHAGDPAVYALGLGLIGLIALAACFIPARRATRVDPLVALRYE